MGVGAPSGTVTFLFTDIEGSTRLWQADEVAMRAALSRHDDLLHEAVLAERGTVFSSMGDGIAAAFSAASEAVRAALAATEVLAAETWPTEAPIRVRMGLHTGEAEVRDGDYFGTAVNRAARLMAVGHGGQVLCSQATAALVDAEVGLVDLGEHRLRDLDRPMRVFQVGGGSFPPLRSLDVLPGNLPSLASSFVGRHKELAEVAKELGAARLVTLTGVGGVGKTRLALQVAAELLPGFGDGAWVCELATAADPNELAQVVAIAMGIAQRPQMTLVESIVDFLRARELLVVLDNCEHVLDAAAGLAEAMLAGALRVRVLATSREGLGVIGERMWPLRSLPVATEDGDAAASEAVTLFTARAEAADPRFVLNEANVASVVEVCRRLDGIPLAIELAAARVATMSPAEIAGHLDERFRLLAGGRRRGVERHQTLRAAIEWSYSLLTEAERAVFDRLGVFPTSFEEAAAVAVCAIGRIERWDVIDALASLVAKSMVGVERAEDATRYQLLETLRHFARDRADAAGDLDGLRRRHADHYAGLAELLGAGLTGPDELTWTPRLAAEIDNLRAATGWAFEAPSTDDARIGIRILDSLTAHALGSPVWGIQGWSATALPIAEELGVDERAVVFANASIDAFYAGDVERIMALGDRVIAESQTATAALLVAFCNVAMARSVVGDPQGTMALLAEGRRRFATAGASDYLRGSLDAVTGWMAHEFGDVDTARSAAADTLAAARRVGSPRALAGALALWARTLPDDHADEALASAEESVRLVEAGAAAESSYGGALQTLTLLRAARGDTTGAARAIHTAISYNSRNGLRIGLGTEVGFSVPLLIGANNGAHAVATLAGAVDGPVLKGRMNISPAQCARYERALAWAAETLDAGPHDADRQQGAAMTYDEIVVYILDQLDRLADG